MGIKRLALSAVEGLSPFALAGALAGVLAAAAWLALSRPAAASAPDWRVETAYPVYSHDDLAGFRVRGPVGARPVLRVNGGGASRPVDLAPAGPGLWTARWPLPWNLPAGRYEASVEGAAAQRPALFSVRPPRPSALPERLSAVTFEAAGPLSSFKLESPNGGQDGPPAMLDWAALAGARALWLRPGPGKPRGWEAEAEELSALAQEAHRRGLKLGLCLDALGSSRRSGENGPYLRALDLKRGQLVESGEISAGDLSRASELGRELGRLAALPGVDYIGLSRLGSSGGFELADAFFKEMPGLSAPEGWAGLSSEAQAAWLSRRLEVEPALSEPWRWFRAQRAARFLRAVRASAASDKPFWVFMPAEDLGRSQGLDAAMLADAGSDLTVLQLFETDAAGFSRMLRSWAAYLGRSPLPIGVADVPDWALHQFTTFPSGPESLAQRLTGAAGLLCPKDRPRALVLFDLGRALTAPLGPYPARAWVESARTAALDFNGLPKGDALAVLEAKLARRSR